jgi:hypothetical protein
MLMEAFKNKASDIHVEPLEKDIRIRFRMDGVLVDIEHHPKRLQSRPSSAASRSWQARCSIAEKRMPQDGRIQINVNDKRRPRPACVVIPMRTTVKPSSCVSWTRAACQPRVCPSWDFFSDDQQTFERPDHLVGRHRAGDRTHRFRQNHDPVRLPEPHQQAGPQNHHGGRPGRISDVGHQPGACAHRDRADLRGRPAVHSASGAQHHHDR